jgi:DNA-binding transcriptional MerR regulator
MRIKELEEKSGIPRTTIHFYLRHGLLHPPQKTGRTMAYYNETHLQRLKQIESLKKGSRVPLSYLKEKIGGAGISPQSVSKDYDVRIKAATTKEKAKKRQEIIKKAIEVFTRKGYHRTKVVDITDSLKISTGTFYIYFQTKRFVH